MIRNCLSCLLISFFLLGEGFARYPTIEVDYDGYHTRINQDLSAPHHTGLITKSSNNAPTTRFLDHLEQSIPTTQDDAPMQHRKFPYIRTKRFIPLTPTGLALKTLWGLVKRKTVEDSGVFAEVSKLGPKYQSKIGGRLTFPKLLGNKLFMGLQRDDNFTRFFWKNNTSAHTISFGVEGKNIHWTISTKLQVGHPVTWTMTGGFSTFFGGATCSGQYTDGSGGTGSCTATLNLMNLPKISAYVTRDYTFLNNFKRAASATTFGLDVDTRIGGVTFYLSKTFQKGAGAFRVGVGRQGGLVGLNVQADLDPDTAAGTVGGNVNVLKLGKDYFKVFGNQQHTYDRKMTVEQDVQKTAGAKLHVWNTQLQGSVFKKRGQDRKYTFRLDQLI